MKSEIEEILQKILQFRDERDWEQFHNLKDLSMGLSIEASELMELLLWKTPEEIEKYISNNNNLTKIKDELADIIIYCLLIKNELKLDINEIVSEKLKKNALKYPVESFKGCAKKYNELSD